MHANVYSYSKLTGEIESSASFEATTINTKTTTLSYEMKFEEKYIIGIFSGICNLQNIEILKKEISQDLENDINLECTTVKSLIINDLPYLDNKLIKKIKTAYNNLDGV